MNKLRKQADLIFYKISTLGALFFSIFILFAFLLQKNLRLLLSAQGSKLAEICNCTGYLSFSDRPELFISLFLSSALVSIFFIFSLIKYFSLRFKTKRYISNSLKYSQEVLSAQSSRVADELGLGARVVEVDNGEFNIFCYGFLRPKICLSKNLLKRLTSQELKAVFLHEKHHIRSFDNLKLFIVNFVSSSLFFVPQLKIWARRYYSLSELAADKFTIEGGGKNHLASAMYKFLKSNESNLKSSGLALASFNLLIDERINKMKDASYEIKSASNNRVLILSLASLTLFALLFIFSIKTSSAALIHSSSSCMAKTNSLYTACAEGDMMSPCLDAKNIQTDKLDCPYEMGQSTAYLKR